MCIFPEPVVPENWIVTSHTLSSEARQHAGGQSDSGSLMPGAVFSRIGGRLKVPECGAAAVTGPGQPRGNLSSAGAAVLAGGGALCFAGGGSGLAGAVPPIVCHEQIPRLPDV